MTRTVRLIALTNDAYALAAGNFPFPIYAWRADSKSTDSVNVVQKDSVWKVSLRSVRQLTGINPEGEVYQTLQDRLIGLPRGYTWKMDYARCLYETPTDVHMLDWQRDTIHQSFSTEETYQSYILEHIRKVWGLCIAYYKKFEDVELGHFKPSILALEAVDGDKELASDFDFLMNMLKTLRIEKNPISKAMYDVVWRVEKKRGTWEYLPYET